MTRSKQGMKKRPNPEQTVTRTVRRLLNCGSIGHNWQPTTIEGLILCTRCQKVAACRICAPQTARPDTWGLCRKHQGSTNTQEVQA